MGLTFLLFVIENQYIRVFIVLTIIPGMIII